MSVLLCPQEHFNQVLSCHVRGDSSGAGGSSCCGHGGHSSRLPPCRGNGSGCWGTLWGPLTLRHAQRKPQLPSQPRRASGSCGLSCPVCLALESCHVMYCSVCLAPEGSWYPLTSPGNFFMGGKSGSGCRGQGRGDRGQGPRRPSAMASRAPSSAMVSRAPSSAMVSRAPSSAMVSRAPSSAMASRAPSSTMASWAPCTAMASRAPSSAMVPVCLFHSGGPRPVFLSVFVLRGLQSAHPPSPMELLRLGTSLSGGGSNVSPLSCVSCVPTSCVHIWFVSCPRQMSLWVKYVPAVFVSLCVNYPLYISPVFWVWFRLVYSLLPGVSCLWVLPCPALMWLNTIIWVYILVCVFLFLPRVCIVTTLKALKITLIKSISAVFFFFSDRCSWNHNILFVDLTLIDGIKQKSCKNSKILLQFIKFS